MKKLLSIVLVLALVLCFVPALADDGSDSANPYNMGPGSTMLRSLTHNCPNTGKMLPEAFSPYQTTYLLTVANWVTNIKLTPVPMDSNAVVTVNGKVIPNGVQTQVATMTNDPQVLEIVVSNNGESTVYTMYLQRRPSERRTRVSAGYINDIYQDGTKWMIDADLVSVKYSGADYNSGNISTFTNNSAEHYRYEVETSCNFYYGVKSNCYRANNIFDFKANYMNYGSNLYTIVYIEDKIVAVFPYGADY